MRTFRVILGSSLLLMVAALLFLQPGSKSADNQAGARSINGAQDITNQSTDTVIVSDPVEPVLTIPARDAPPVQFDPKLDREINPRIDPYGRTDPGFRVEGGPDPLLDLQANAPAGQATGFDTPIFNFEGQDYTFLNPPDTVGDIGSDHYIQMVNATVVSIYDKTDASLISRFDLTTLGGCSTGNGDPIVLYDHLADRWLLSEFGPGNSLCVFISQTPDPTGAYFSYQFSTPSFPDYPKYGVWPDAYYVTSNEGSGPANYALDRDEMLLGNPATSQRFTAPPLSGFGFQALTPADLDGPPPPAGAPNYIMRHRDTEAHGPAGFPTEDFLEIWGFSVDWANPGNSSFTQVANISVSEFDSDICGFFAFSGIPMPGVPKCSNSSLDPLREVVMFRLQYRNFGSHEALVGNLVTDVTGNDDAGVRWFELRKVGAGAWGLHQEGTYAPDGDGRWMGAIAMDGSGNIALGYNVSGSATFPSLRYTGRLATDPLGTMPQGEYNIVDGSGVNGSNRYGDYSAMSVDPEDDCTFWFTGEYNPTSQWSTRIAAFRFDACGGPFHLEPEPPDLAVCVPDDAVYDIRVLLDQPGFSDPVDLDAVGEPAGTTVNFSLDNLPPPFTSTLTIGNTGAASAGSYSVAVVGMAPTATHTTTIGLRLFDTTPTVSLVSPPDGAVDLPVTPTFEWSGTGTAYTIDIATDPAFANIVETATVDDVLYTSMGLDPLTTYYWRVTANNPCGEDVSATWSFTTADIPNILLVDDDNNSPDVRGTYENALNALGLDYDVWDTNNSDNEPSAGELGPYGVVIWFTGVEFGGAAGPGSAGESALSSWLDDSNCLFISSQDYHFDRGLTSFMSNYLGASNITDDNGNYNSVTGQGTVYSGLGPYSLNYPFNDYSDTIQPDGTAEVAFQGNNGNNSAVNKDAGTYRTTFWVYPWEAISTAPGREEALQTTLDWCGELIDYGVNLSGDMVASGDPGDTVDYLVDITNTGNVSDTYQLTTSGNSWTTNLSTTSITLDAGETISFTVSVMIPAGAFGGDEDTVTVTATSVNDPGTSDLVNLTTSVTITYGVGLSGDNNGEGVTGSAVEYTLEVVNNGNATDTFNLSLSGNSWTTNLSTTSITLDAGETISFTVSVMIPAGAMNGDMDTVTVTATSAGDPGTSASLNITTTATDYRLYLPIMLMGS